MEKHVEILSHKAEFKVDGKWYDNAIRIAALGQCTRYASDKFDVWTMPSDWRVVESTDTPNYTYNDTLEAI